MCLESWLLKLRRPPFEISQQLDKALRQLDSEHFETGYVRRLLVEEPGLGTESWRTQLATCDSDTETFSANIQVQRYRAKTLYENSVHTRRVTRSSSSRELTRILNAGGVLDAPRGHRAWVGATNVPACSHDGSCTQCPREASSTQDNSTQDNSTLIWPRYLVLVELVMLKATKGISAAKPSVKRAA